MNLREAKAAAKKANLNPLDKVISYFSPEAGKRRLRARAALEILSYAGADRKRRALKSWNPGGGDADSDILPDLPTLRENSRDLLRNSAIATGAIKTKLTNVIGTGLIMHPRVDREVIGLSQEQSDELERHIEREWRLFWHSQDCDIARKLDGHAITRLVYQQAKENGDVAVLLPQKASPRIPYTRRLQVIEADRISNENDAMDTDSLAGGVEKDEYGAPVAYHISDQHPGSLNPTRSWTRYPAFGSATGLPNVIHLMQQTRPGQSRGVPDLAAVVEPLKQLSRYTEAELDAAVVAGLFTVFIETETGQGGFDYSNLGGEVGQKAGDNDLKLGSGLIMDLAAGEKVSTANPGRPNDSFDPFVQAILRQVGSALEIPYEILIKHFTASYSAARAALLEMWKYVLAERKWLVDNFLRQVYGVWFHEAVVSGRIQAPGFFADHRIRAAYLGAEFVGPAKGQLREDVEVKAAVSRIDAGLSTIADETAEMTGRDWEKNHPQQVKERNKRLADGLISEQEDEDNGDQTGE